MAQTEVAASHFSKDTVEFIRLLADYHVRYVVVGGEAVIFYGHARLTGDVGFFYDLNPENLDSLHEMLLDFWSGSIPGDLSTADLSVPMILFGATVEASACPSKRRKQTQSIMQGQRRPSGRRTD